MAIVDVDCSSLRADWVQSGWLGRIAVLQPTVQTEPLALSVGLSVTVVSPAKNGWTDRDAIWVVDSGASEEACVTWGCTLAKPGEYDWIGLMSNCVDHFHLLLHFAWVVDDAKCIVVTRVCVSVCVCVCLHAYTIARTWMLLGEW